MKIAIISQSRAMRIPRKGIRVVVSAEHEGSRVSVDRVLEKDSGPASSESHAIVVREAVARYVAGQPNVAAWSVVASAPLDGGSRWAHVVELQFRSAK